MSISTECPSCGEGPAMSEIVACVCGVLVRVRAGAPARRLRCPRCRRTIATDPHEPPRERSTGTAVGEHQCSPGEAARRKHHVSMLVLAAMALAGAFLLTVRSDGRVALRILPGMPLPPSCSSRAVFGVDCPGCGLTRSFIYLAEGDLRASFSMHRIGWLLALAVVLQIPYRLIALRHSDGRPLGNWLPTAIGYTVIGLLIGNWAVENIWR